ncbi:serine hydrolase domain-containing protein [Chondrinema litorale]|uniref:serine hydrolase domain-containing protein n=1 Tax=Chondrinema litorale TaxID=2994555 RepID=UPI00254272E9|nr:serine hydrolase [Chondrinema litorale]UZR97034.1 serine hydrolase [Chondrinema litorale]
MLRTIYLSIIAIFLSASCTEDGTDVSPIGNDTSELYFPPLTGSTWETVSPDSLGWNSDKIPDLISFLEESNSRAFLVLKDGKIAIEHYAGKTLIGFDFNKNSNWYWASAGKTLTSFLVGIAQEEGYLDIDNPSSDYLGTGWTSLTTEQEAKITVLNQLTMTSGLDDASNADCTDPECLEYLADPGERWAYHNAPYTLLDGVIEGATDEDFDTYFEDKIADKIGITGFWEYVGSNHVYFSDARSMARYGLMVLNNGKWQTETEEITLLGDENYLEAMVNTSQTLNPSYGYLWWLNGKGAFQLPGLQLTFNEDLCPDAPEDMFAAMGKNGQLLDIVPSQNLIVIRMGELPSDDFVPTTFQNDIWEKLNDVIGVE